MNDRKVGGVAELETALQALKQGETAAVQVERLGQLQYLMIEILD